MRNVFCILVLVSLTVAATAAADEAGFVSLFDGKTLEGWSCPAMKYWSVEDGAITARNTEPIKECYYLVWQGGRPADFELKATFRIQGPKEANSGIQLRSKVRPDGFVEGYQADITREPKYCGALYDETPNRGLLAAKGQRVLVDEQGHRKTEQFADADELWKKINLDGWNEYHITARGFHVAAKINGHLMWEVTDREEGRHGDAPGVIALQLHVGPPMQVQFKDIRLKVLRTTDKPSGVSAPGRREAVKNAFCRLMENRGADLTDEQFEIAVDEASASFTRVATSRRESAASAMYGAALRSLAEVGKKYPNTEAAAKAQRNFRDMGLKVSPRGTLYDPREIGFYSDGEPWLR